MKIKLYLLLFSLCFLSFAATAQTPIVDSSLAKMNTEGYTNSKAMSMLHTFTDVYGQRINGSREYLAAATWAADKMKEIGLDNVHFETNCKDCRGWTVRGFNVELVAPNYMHIIAYPLAETHSTAGVVEGELINIPSFAKMDEVKAQFAGKLKGKIILLGGEPRSRALTEPVMKRYSDAELDTMEKKPSATHKQTPLPTQLEEWKTSDHTYKEFMLFAEQEGALAVLRASGNAMGIVGVGGTYEYLAGDFKVLPYFAIMSEHFSRLLHMLQQKVVPKIRLNLETEIYTEPANNVNIIGEIKGTDPKLKAETVMVGGHFDSWHAGTGATDNGVSCIAMLEALRILKQTGIAPRRTIRVGFWGGEEQAFVGSVSYVIQHFGPLNEKPNNESKKITAYLNLDNGAGAIRGVYLQNNENARQTFKEVFAPISSLTRGTTTIENTLSTDHESFDHYNIPAFQFIQDGLNYGSVTHHTHLDLPEYVPESDLKKNAVILAWTLYALANRDGMVPRK